MSEIRDGGVFSHIWFSCRARAPRVPVRCCKGIDNRSLFPLRGFPCLLDWVGELGFDDWMIGGLEGWCAYVESYVYQLICAHAQRSSCLGSRIQYSCLR